MLNSMLRLRSHAQLRMHAHGGYKTSWVRTQLRTPPWAYAQWRAKEGAHLTRWPSFIQTRKRPDGTLWLTKITNLQLFINNINFRLKNDDGQIPSQLWHVVVFGEKWREYRQNTFCMITGLTSQWTTEQQLYIQPKYQIVHKPELACICHAVLGVYNK